MPKTPLKKLRSKISWLKYRFLWATIWRKYRNERYEVYDGLTDVIREHLIAIWRILDLQPGKAMPEMNYVTFKVTGAVGFWFSWEDKSSHKFMLGQPEPKKAAYISDLTTNEWIPYYTHPEIIAAKAIVALTKDPRANGGEQSIATESEVNELLASYHMHLVTDYGESHPTEISDVWLTRLNTTVINLVQNAPIWELIAELHEEGTEFEEACKRAFKEIDINSIKLPGGAYSNNEDGRKNLSYEGSCFYTIDRRGVAVCKEFPSELLDLSDYEVMVRVAATIIQDVTGCADDDKGLLHAMRFFSKNEPEWMGDNLFPWERGEKEQQEVEAA